MSTATNRLRAELFGATDRTPGFAVLLPTGWGRLPGSGDDLAEHLRASVRRVPNIDVGQLVRSIDGVLAGSGVGRANDERVIGLLAQTDVPVDSFVPMSIALSWVQAPPGNRITSLARQLVDGRGAAPLGPDRATLRWVDRADQSVDNGLVHTVHPTYLIRVPNTVDTALLIRATILDGADQTRIGEDGISAMTLMSDSIVSTFRWRRNG